MRFIQLGQKGNNKAISIFFTVTAVIAVFLIVQIVSLFIALAATNTGESSRNLDQITTVMGANTFLAIQLIPFSFSLITLLLCVKWIHKREIRSVFTTRNAIDWKRFFLSN